MTADQKPLWNIHMGDLFDANWRRTSKRVLVLSTDKAHKENPDNYDEVVSMKGTDFDDDDEKKVLAETTITS